jgi:hypothetical protein
MPRSLRAITVAVALAATLTGISLAGCSSDVSQNQSSSSGQQSSTSSQGSTNQATQQQPGSSSQQPSGAANMNVILTRAAEILGISSDDFIAAFQNAMPQGGPSGQGQPGQLPAPPSGEQGQPPMPPSGEQGQPPAPPSGQQPSQSSSPQFMTEVYEKMAAELNISADDIAEAIAQAEKELQ